MAFCVFVFKKRCSAGAARLFLIKMLVRRVPLACFSQKWLFPHPGTLVFFKNACSRIPERLFFSKMTVPASRNTCLSQKQLFRTREYSQEVRTAVPRMRFFGASGFPCTLRGGFREKTICRAEQGSVLPGKLFVVSKNDFMPVLTVIRA